MTIMLPKCTVVKKRDTSKIDGEVGQENSLETDLARSKTEEDHRAAEDSTRSGLQAVKGQVAARRVEILGTHLEAWDLRVQKVFWGREQ